VSLVLRVAVLNLRHDADRWPERLPLIVEELARERPHLVGLQEVFVPIDQAAVLTECLNRACAGLASAEAAEGAQCDRYTFRLQSKTWPEGLKEGIAVLSRLPVEEHDWLDLRGGARVAQRVRVRLPGGRALDFYNTHLHHELLADALRREQAMRLLDWMKVCSPDMRAILVGDLNARPESGAVRLLKSSLVSAYEVANGREPEYTFPTPLVKQTLPWRATLDYILLPPASGARVLRAWRAFERPAAHDPTLYASDHYGLMADVELEEQPA